MLTFLLLVILASGADLLADFSEGVNLAHLLQEAAIMLFAASVFIWIAGKLRRSRQDMRALKHELESIKSTQQSEEILAIKQQFSEVISNQFTLWNLTKSEQEVGLLLLKGFSLNEIAYLRKTAEKTVRQQASSIYKKSNVAGRHAFSAWFIEDFL
ncbi:response regulator transcription factor [Thalassomonas viridans]|uniref:Response regulator transcription factor n=1 Tax=Thalassomonas viridans TaxID=137584 RepID=A0AAE9ZBF8_9GAMM|nr:response regulator transcription factor [Thalassomonas viridans]